MLKFKTLISEISKKRIVNQHQLTAFTFLKRNTFLLPFVLDTFKKSSIGEK